MDCIVEIFQELDAYNHRYSSEYGEVEIGIGLHYGSLVVGTVGTSERMDMLWVQPVLTSPSRWQADSMSPADVCIDPIHSADSKTS